MREYYIYCHIRLDNGQPFYIGKGKDDRAYKKTGRNEWWSNIVNKHGYDILILDEHLEEEESLELEKHYISRLGRKDLGKGILVNMTDGGEGVSGRIMSDGLKVRLSEINKGKSMSNEFKAKISKVTKGCNNPMFGKKHTEEALKKISDAAKGNKNCVGRIISDESRLKISIGNTGKDKRSYKNSVKWEKYKHPWINRKHTEESRERMSETATKLRGKLVIDLESGIFYNSLKEAYNSLYSDNPKVSYSKLKDWMNPKRAGINKSNLRYED